MTFSEILELDIIKLPKTQDIPEDGFREFFTDLFDEFLDIVVSSKNLSDQESFKEAHFKNGIGVLVKGIQNAIDRYYAGNPFNAYTSLRDSINDSRILSYLPSDMVFDEGSNFYRIREHQGNYLLDQKELFHIPFNLRGKVTTNRYSIPGFPSLYLSDCIYTAWEELQRPSYADMQIVRLENQMPINILDLSTTRYSEGNHTIEDEESTIGKSNWGDLYSVMVWPLIAACSVKVRDRNDPFKPEYIIPQLLLNWVRNNNSLEKRIDGIKFSSTHIDLNNEKVKGEFYNLVIPVKESLDHGYCSHLLKMFNMTEVVSWQLQQAAGASRRTIELEEFGIMLNDKRQIELIRGEPLKYSNSDFGMLEVWLNRMNAQKIDVL
ncbi:MAG: hypothetical protein JKY52_16585 [Flavobacteriales bacterium]|nr:hypothetical protein [Flavobacteriales bacterium]